MPTFSYPKRGEIWLVALDPTVGSEIKKTRPCVVIQNDTGNEHAPTTIIAPITSTLYQSPITIEVQPSKASGLKNLSCVNLAQIRCVDKRRLVKRLGVLHGEEMQAVDQAIRRSLDV